jgi:hypothetical protein
MEPIAKKNENLLKEKFVTLPNIEKFPFKL